MSDEDIEKLGQRLKELRTERQLIMDMLVYDLNKKYNIEITKGNISRELMMLYQCNIPIS